jgi:hypothetical protein
MNGEVALILYWLSLMVVEHVSVFGTGSEYNTTRVVTIEKQFSGLKPQHGVPENI